MRNFEILTWRMPNTPIDLFEELHTIFASIQIDGVVKIGTCQRIVFATTSQNSDTQIHKIISSIPPAIRTPAVNCMERFRSRDAFLHMVNVTAGLESYVIGETQISHQIKNAYKIHKKSGALSGELDRTFQEVFKLSKKIQSTTGIPQGKISVLSLLEDEIAASIHSQRISKVAIVGTGEMGRKAHALLKRIKPKICITWFTSRNDLLETGKYLSSPAAHKDEFVVGRYDAVFLATHFPLTLTNHHDVSLVVDLALPRGVVSTTNSYTNVVTLEDLKMLAETNLSKRKELKEESSEIITEHLDRLERKEILHGYRDKILGLRKRLLTAGERKKVFLLEHNGLDNHKKIEKLIDSAINEVVHVAQKEIEDLIIEEIK